MPVFGTPLVIQVPSDPWPGMGVPLLGSRVPTPCPSLLPVLWIGTTCLFACPQGSAPWGGAPAVRCVIGTSITCQSSLLSPGLSCPHVPKCELTLLLSLHIPWAPSCTEPRYMARFCLSAPWLMSTDTRPTLTSSQYILGLTWAGGQRPAHGDDLDHSSQPAQLLGTGQRGLGVRSPRPVGGSWRSPRGVTHEAGQSQARGGGQGAAAAAEDRTAASGQVCLERHGLRREAGRVRDGRGSWACGQGEAPPSGHRVALGDLRRFCLCGPLPP